MRVLVLDDGSLSSTFGGAADLSALDAIPDAVAPRLAELQRLTDHEASLALASRRDGVIVGLLEGDDVLRHLRFAADGRVAHGRGEPPLYVATVEDLPPF